MKKWKKGLCCILILLLFGCSAGAVKKTDKTILKQTQTNTAVKVTQSIVSQEKELPVTIVDGIIEVNENAFLAEMKRVLDDEGFGTVAEWDYDTADRGNGKENIAVTSIGNHLVFLVKDAETNNIKSIESVHYIDGEDAFFQAMKVSFSIVAMCETEELLDLETLPYTILSAAKAVYTGNSNTKTLSVAGNNHFLYSYSYHDKIGYPDNPDAGILYFFTTIS